MDMARKERGRHKITADEVRAIRADPRGSKKIAAEYGIHWANVCSIKRGDTWTHIGGATPSPKRAKLTEDQVREIRSDPRPLVHIARAYGIGEMQVGRIKRRERWSHIPD